MGLKNITRYKKGVCFSLFFIGIVLTGYSQASDAPGLPYHVPTIVEIIQEAVEQPTDTNEFVQILFEHEDFPVILIGDKLKSSQMKLIEDWVKTHVAEMQDFQQARKKNYDKFYLNHKHQ